MNRISGMVPYCLDASIHIVLSSMVPYHCIVYVSLCHGAPNVPLRKDSSGVYSVSPKGFVRSTVWRPPSSKEVLVRMRAPSTPCMYLVDCAEVSTMPSRSQVTFRVGMPPDEKVNINGPPGAMRRTSSGSFLKKGTALCEREKERNGGGKGKMRLSGENKKDMHNSQISTRS